MVLNPLKVMVIWFPGSRLSVELTCIGTSLVPAPGFTGRGRVVSQPAATNTTATNKPLQTNVIRQFIKSIFEQPIARVPPRPSILGLLILPADISLGQQLGVLLPVLGLVGRLLFFAALVIVVVVIATVIVVVGIL